MVSQFIASIFLTSFLSLAFIHVDCHVALTFAPINQYNLMTKRMLAENTENIKLQDLSAKKNPHHQNNPSEKTDSAKIHLCESLQSMFTTEELKSVFTPKLHRFEVSNYSVLNSVYHSRIERPPIV